MHRDWITGRSAISEPSFEPVESSTSITSTGRVVVQGSTTVV